jgi:Tfp pilus assembly protein PilX
MISVTRIHSNPASIRYQRGAATLLVALSLLVILTIIVLTSSNVGLFEQKTTTNESREMQANQAAEYALNLGGEYLKANVANISSAEDADGWLFAGTGGVLHWKPCPPSPTDANHPCNAEPNSTVRSQLYYYVTDGAEHLNPSTVTADAAALDLFPNATASLPSGGPQLTKVGNDKFPVTAKVGALLCLLDTTPGAAPSCQLNPAVGNRIAVTLVAAAGITGENANALVKETWGTFNRFSAQAAVPLIAAGSIEGLGNASIVASPNAGGYGLPGSMWTPNDADVDDSGSGVGSVTTCHMGDFLGDVPVSELETTCAGHGNTGCGCSNVAKGSPDMLSGHFGGSYKQESIDTLDVDGNHGSPDIQFFPGWSATKNACMDDATVDNDDNLFEWIFGEDVNGASVCHAPPVTAAENTNEIAVLNDLGATIITSCSSLDSNSSGLYYVTGTCSLGTDVGSPDNTVVVVVDGDVKVNGNFNFFGMLYVRDAGPGASLKGTGSPNFFGSIVVEGDVDIAGSPNIIYLNTNTGGPKKKLSPDTRFALLPGSWLDNRSGF